MYENDFSVRRQKCAVTPSAAAPPAQRHVIPLLAVDAKAAVTSPPASRGHEGRSPGRYFAVAEAGIGHDVLLFQDAQVCMSNRSRPSRQYRCDDSNWGKSHQPCSRRRKEDTGRLPFTVDRAVRDAGRHTACGSNGIGDHERSAGHFLMKSSPL